MAFVISSLRGGQNDEDAPTSLADDECVVCRNAEFVDSPLGDRRRGAEAIDLAASILAHSEVTFLHNHVPAGDLTAAELWVLGVTGTSSSTLSRKTTTWADVSLDDAITLTDGAKYRVRGQSLHGKLFLAYKSGVDRLHVHDGSGNVRRVGMAQPAAAPTAANGGGAGSFTGTRYYRVRFTERSGSTTLRRSEPSDTLTFAPGGSNAAAVVTRPAVVSEGETHWELEASVDNANFYVIATTAIGTTTANDTTAYSPGYADDFDLAPDIGDYTLVPSGKFLCVDRDRLVMGGSWEDTDLGSRVTWTPVFKDPGDGNDERLENDQDPRVDLDPGVGGELTNLLTVNGSIWAFKQAAIYKLTASGIRSRAYDVTPISTVRGAIEDSAVEGVDQSGQPAIYFLDPAVGPCRININGVKQVRGVRNTWQSINLDAVVVSRAFYDPDNKQVHWKIAHDGSDTPDLELVLHVENTRDTPEGHVKGGWSVWDGDITEALSVCLFAENIDDNTARSRVLRPFIGTANTGRVWQCDTGTDDNGESFTARILTKPFVRGALLNQFEVQEAVIVGRAVTGAAVDVSIEADFNRFRKQVASVSMTPESDETRVVTKVDNLSISEMRLAQIAVDDTDPPSSGRWELELLALRETGGQA